MIRSLIVGVATFLLSLLCLTQQSNGLMNLSPVESAALKSRLDQIQASVKQEYKTLLSLPEEQDLDTFIFPGSGGVDELVLELQHVTPNSKIVDWKEHRGSILTAAYDAEAVGEAIAEIVEKAGRTKSVHYIGISVGAFCANAAATTTYRARDDVSIREKTTVQLTLLDPFCGRGVFGPNYGRDHFGKYATTAIQILNSDDPVPTTNDPLPNCLCIDVTGASQRETFILLPGDSMHSWPVAYFARHYEEPISPIARGSVITIEN
jgi:hypothetical protein